jgi:RHS repeat-associated protein
VLVSTYVYNGNDQLTSESGTLNGVSSYSTTYGYNDANGNFADGSVTSVTRTGSGAETDTYVYDLQNRLSSANIGRTESGQSVVIAASYTYDDRGPRAQSVVTTTIGSGSPSTTVTQFLVDPANPTGYSQVLEEHINGSATPSVSYLLGATNLGQTDSNGTRYFMVDGQGSTRQIVDSAGAIVAREAYDAYGNIIGPQVGVVNLPLTKILYVGQQFDPALGQYYMRARYYATWAGRFTSMDTFAGSARNPLSMHKYVYASANPVMYLDPSGHDDFSVTGLLATAGISGLLSALLTTAYGVAKGWSAWEIAKAAGYSFLIGALAGALAYSAAWGFAASLMISGATAGEAAATAWTAVGLIASPGSLGFAFYNLMDAVNNGDNTDRAFAVVNLGLASFGFLAANWSAFANAANATAAELPQVTVNNTVGNAARDDFIANMEANGFILAGKEVYADTPFGERIVDTVWRDPETGLNYGVEIKSSMGALKRFDADARRQFAADRWINYYGVVAKGRYKGLRIDGTCKILWRPE